MIYEKTVASFISKSGKYVILFLYFALFYFISPIVFGLFLAYVLFPIFDFFKRLLKLPFSIIVVCLSLLIFTLFGTLLLLVVQSMLQLLPPVQSALHTFSLAYTEHPLLPYFIDKLSGLLNDVTVFFINLVKASLNSFFNLFLFTIAFYFSLFESKKNRLWFFTYTPKAYRAEWSRYFTKVMSLISYFVFVELQLFTLTFLLLSTGFYFLSFDTPISKALVIALADSLPFLGIGLFLIPLSAYFFFVQNHVLAIAILLLYLFVQITRQLTESMLWSHTLHIRMIHTFLISAASILLFGFYGILLSPLLLMVAIKLKESAIFAK